MTDAQRAHLRALAQRVRTEEPSDELRDAVLIALGWEKSPHLLGLYSPSGGYWECPPNPLTSLDAAAGAMPEGWRIWEITQGDAGFRAALCHLTHNPWLAEATAPTLPRAWTAADLEAKAAEGEA